MVRLARTAPWARNAYSKVRREDPKRRSSSVPKSEGVGVELGRLVILDRHRAEDEVDRCALDGRAVPVGVFVVVIFLLFRESRR